MTRKRLVRQLLLIHLAIVGAALVAAGWFSLKWVEETNTRAQFDRLAATAHLIADKAVPGFTGAPAALEASAAEVGRGMGVRITLIQTDGEVLFDTDEEVALLDNHAARPEIVTALAGDEGRSNRYSVSLARRMLYYATPVCAEGRVVGVVRAAMPIALVDSQLVSARLGILGLGLLIFLLATLTAWYFIRRAIRPITKLTFAARALADGNLAAGLPLVEIDELTGLSEAISQLARQVDERSRVLGRKGYEQQAVLASMVEGVLAVDLQERVISLNRAAAELIGSRQADVPGRSLQEILRNAELRRFARRALESEEPIETDVVLHGQGDKILRIRGTALRDAAGRSVGAVIVLHDITHFRHLETLRQEFVANVSHELKTPIASIKGFVETLLDGALAQPDDAVRFLHIIARQADRLNSIIEDLLSLAKIEESEQALDLPVEEGPLGPVLEAVLADCQAKAAERDIEIQISCDSQLRAMINAPLLEQAVANLLDNAVKYSEPGSVVRVDAERRNGEAVIVVSDQGCGIGNEHLSRVFERFYRVDKARSRKLGGTGLGLAIVKHIVQAHRGRITVVSILGEGSTFMIFLPELDMHAAPSAGPR
jgi:two-component system phosphate regulon sensor histidine kinase PhoR